MSREIPAKIIYRLRNQERKPTNSDILWLLDSTSSSSYVGFSLSLDDRSEMFRTSSTFGNVQALFLYHSSKMLVVKLEGHNHNQLLHPLESLLLSEYGRSSTDGARHLTAFDGAFTILLLHADTNLQIKLRDTSSVESLDEKRTKSELCSDILGSGAYRQIKSLKPDDFQSETGRGSLSANWIHSAKLAILSSLVSSSTYRQAPTLDSRVLERRELEFLSTSAKSSNALDLLSPKRREAQVSDIKDNKDGTMHVVNEHFRSRVRVSRDQRIGFKGADQDQFNLRASEMKGRTTVLKGSTFNSVKNFATLEIRGKEDLSPAEIDMRNWWRDVMRLDSNDEDKTFDPSGLLRVLLFDEKTSALNYLRIPTSKISSLSNLTPSQREAALEILRAKKSQITLIQGPPGTGKTKVIGAVCKEWEDLSRIGVRGLEQDDSIYAVCQSNVAVKNIALSLQRARVDFKIIVTNDFHDEWHEDIYKELRHELLLTSELSYSPVDLERTLGSSNVILCTISTLSNPRLASGRIPLFRLRPMRALLVDEASQILLNAYPHVFARFSSTLSRVAFFGDDEQLAPYGSENVSSVKSVFQLRHLKEKGMFLDLTFRLPKVLTQFISREIYESRLLPGDNVWKGGWESCIRSIDVRSGSEEKVGTSFINEAEVKTVRRLMTTYYNDKDTKILTQYTRQRDALEKELKGYGLDLDWENKCYSVDSFQGNEAKVIIISLARTSTPGFLSVLNRTNVLLTRTSRIMIIVTSKDFIFGAARNTLVGRMALQAGAKVWVDEADVMHGKADLPKKDSIFSPTRSDPDHGASRIIVGPPLPSGPRSQSSQSSSLASAFSSMRLSSPSPNLSSSNFPALTNTNSSPEGKKVGSSNPTQSVWGASGRALTMREGRKDAISSSVTKTGKK